MEDRTRQENYEIVENFVNANSHLYDGYTIMRIKDFMKHAKYPAAYHIDIIREILDYLGKIPDSENIYIEFLNQIESLFPINGKNIVEVGCGAFPNLAKRMKLKQKSGTITVYDPRLDLRVPKTEGLILKKETFTRNTPIENTDLLVGLMPCKGAEPIIDQAIKNKIDFIIWLCEGGPHGDYYDFYEDDEEWLYSMTSIARRGIEDNKMGKFQKKYIKKYSEIYPIIYNSRNY